MNYDKLNQIIDNYINDPNYSFFILSNDLILDYAKEILNKRDRKGLNYISCKIDLNKSINIVYDFLNELDPKLANCYYNIINSKDDNGEAYVSFLPRIDNKNKFDSFNDGKVNLYYMDIPFDAFIILHELLHKMNESTIVSDNHKYFSSGRRVFGELVSVTGELLLGDYMVKNNYINEFYRNYVYNFRLMSSKFNSKSFIIESELINLKMYDRNIDENTLHNLYKKYDPNSIQYVVLSDFKLIDETVNCIIKNNTLGYDEYYEYIIAQYFADRIMECDNKNEIFLHIHDLIGDVNCTIKDVFDYLESNLNKKY